MLTPNSIYSRIMNINPVQRQSIISFFWQIVFTGIGFISTMYFAHVVGASTLGAYFLFMAYYSIFDMISNGGFGQAAVKRISEGEETNEFFSVFMVIRTIFTTVVLIILVTFNDYFVDLNESGLFIWLIAILMISIFEGGVSVGVAGRGKMGIRTTCAGIGNIFRVIFQIIAVFIGYKAAGLAAGAAAGLLVATITEFRFFDLHFKYFNWHHVKSLLNFSFWIFLTSGGILVFSQADTILIGYFLDNADVGVYRVALQFTMVATFSTYALRATLWPKVSQWGKSGKLDLVEESLTRAFSYSLVLAVPVFMGGVLLGDKLLWFFYGAEFAQGYAALIVLLAVQVVNVFQYFFTMYLDALDFPKESFKVTAVGVIANIILNVMLIPIIGILGAAIATFVTMTLNALLARRALSRIISVRLEYYSLLNIFAASVAMAIIIGVYRMFMVQSNVWITLLGVVIGGLVYGGLILKLDKKMHDEIQSIVEGMGFVWPSWL